MSGERHRSGGEQPGGGEVGGELRLKEWELRCRWRGAGERLRGGVTGRLAGGRMLLAAGDLLARFGAGGLLGEARLDGITSMPRSSVRVSASAASSGEGPFPGLGFRFLGSSWTSSLVFLLDGRGPAAEAPRTRVLALSLGRSTRRGAAVELALAHWRASAPDGGGPSARPLRTDTRGSLVLARRSRPRAALVEICAGEHAGVSTAGRFSSQMPGGEVIVELVASRPAPSGPGAEPEPEELPRRAASGLEASLETRWLVRGVHRLALRHLVRRAPGLAWRSAASGRGETSLQGLFRRDEWRLRWQLSHREDLASRPGATSLPLVTALSIGASRWRRWGSLGGSVEAITARSARAGSACASASGWMAGLRFDRQDHRLRAGGGGGARGGLVFFRTAAGAGALSFFEGGVEGGRTRRAAGSGISGWCLLSLPGRHALGGWSIGLSLTRFSGRPWESRLGLRCDG